MQTAEQEERPVPPPDPQSQPVAPLAPAQDEEDESDDPDRIFRRAVAEIDTQPLARLPLPARHEPLALSDVLEICLLVGVCCVSLFGVVWQCLIYPHTLVVLYARAVPASLTTTLELPTSMLAPVTLTRSAILATTGTGHRNATAASGTLTFHNGQFQSISIPRGSVFTGRDGEQVVTTQDALIPAADPATTPPTYGQMSVAAQAMHPGASGNMAAFDINGSCCATSVIVKNLAAFTKGRDARTFQAVAAQDLTAATTTVSGLLTQAWRTAFPVQPGEGAIPATCQATTTANRQVGEGATSVAVTTVETCSALAYRQQAFTRAATTAFSRTRPTASYHLIGSVQTTVTSASPVTVALSGTWAYTFTPSYEQELAQDIQGDSPVKARASLLRTGVISYASIPGTLPAAMYINFLVVVG